MSRGSGLDYQKPSRPTQTIVRPLHARASLATRAGTCFCRPQARMQPTMSLGTGPTPVHTMTGEPGSQVCSVPPKGGGGTAIQSAKDDVDMAPGEDPIEPFTRCTICKALNAPARTAAVRLCPSCTPSGCSSGRKLPNPDNPSSSASTARPAPCARPYDCRTPTTAPPNT